MSRYGTSDEVDLDAEPGDSQVERTMGYEELEIPMDSEEVFPPVFDSGEDRWDLPESDVEVEPEPRMSSSPPARRVSSSPPRVERTMGYEESLEIPEETAEVIREGSFPPVFRQSSAEIVLSEISVDEPSRSELPPPLTSESPREELRAQPRPNRYEEHELLGEGGMGQVRLAVDREIRRKVAVKRLLDTRVRARARFMREVRIMGRLEHPNIAPVHDVDMDAEGRPYFVMKHVEGETLAEVIAKLRAGDREYLERWSFEARIELFLGVLRALDYAHSKGVLHRDIKPANIMVGEHGEVTVLDWGLAVRLKERDVDWSRLSGTPSYMSPEQARGEVLKAGSDLYSASVVFHELVTLEHYLGPPADQEETLTRVAHLGWRSPMMAWMKPRRRPMPPMELFHFIRKGMAHSRAGRFTSARRMSDELVHILEGRFRVQCPFTAVKRVTRGAGRFVDRHPFAALGIFSMTLLSAAYGAFVALARLSS